MARNSKISGISIDYDYFEHRRHLYQSIIFHRKNVPTNNSYKIKHVDIYRVRDLLKKADYVVHFIRPNSILIQGYYESKFYYKKWFRRLFSILEHGWWVFVWIYILYILYLKIIVGE